MKAAYFTQYGSIDRLTVRDVPKPSPGENEVLVRNLVSAVNFGNVAHVKGEPFFVRAFTGFGKTKFPIPGGDIAGVVEAVGGRIAGFKPGDEVMGDSSDSGFGAYAEYVSVPKDVLVTKPANLSFQEAATLPLSCSVALAGLARKGNVEAGQKVLLAGSTGGVGSFAVQVAKACGAEVTAVCRGEYADYVRSLGADRVIDYTRDDFTGREERYDLVVGIAGSRSMSDYQSVLTPTGTYVNVGGSMRQFRSAVTTGWFRFLFTRQRFAMLMHRANSTDLETVRELAESGKVRAPVDREYTLEEIVDAFRYYESGQAVGKIVITINASGT